MKTPRTAGSCYDYINDNWFLINKEYPDITAAFYDGDFTKTLEQAQKDKHEWVLQGINFKPGNRILDIGCGWGPMLNAIREMEGQGIGFTLSKKQVEYCRNKGLDVYFQDWKDSKKTNKSVDGIVSIGAFEHFCSPIEYKTGKQEEIYNNFFEFCNRVLKDKGRLFLQTMTWEYKVPTYDEVFESEKSDYHSIVRKNILGLSSWWPPESEEQIIKIASPYFNFLSSNCGREDYAQTFFEWHKRWKETPLIKKMLSDVKTIFKYFRDSDSHKILKNYKQTRENQYFREAFLQKVLSHSRIFFEKK